MRAGIAAEPALSGLIALMDRFNTFRVQVDINEDGVALLSRQAESQMERISRFPHGAIRVHSTRMSDTTLWNYLAELDVAVLPYRYGTHSGWAEACFDLGTAVAAPDGTCIAAQHGSFGSFDLSDTESMLRVVSEISLVQIPAVRRASVRARQRIDIAMAHRRMYETILARGL